MEQAIQKGIADNMIKGPIEKTVVFELDTKLYQILEYIMAAELVYFSFSYLEEKEDRDEIFMKNFV